MALSQSLRLNLFFARADPDSEYKPAVDLQPLYLPYLLMVTSQGDGQGDKQGDDLEMSKGLPRGQGQGHTLAQPCMPPGFNCVHIPYNGA
jgi:hypothetical protein